MGNSGIAEIASQNNRTIIITDFDGITTAKDIETAVKGATGKASLKV